MSYEGYTQRICEEGHYYETDAYQENPKCPFCNTPSKWSNEVDETNGESVGQISKQDLDANFMMRHRVTHQCICGHVHEVEPAIYKIPSEHETKRLRKGFTNYSELSSG